MYTLALAALAGAVVARTTTNYTITFDGDFNYSAPVPAGNLSFQGFSQGPFDYEAEFCAFVCPESFPGEAQVNPGAYISARYPNSSVAHFEVFDFYFGCNGYVNDTENGNSNSVKVIANCTITVDGYKTVPRPKLGPVMPLASQTFVYVPQLTKNPETGYPAALMTHAFLDDSFKGLRYFTFQANYTSPAYYYQNQSYAWDAPVQFLVDNFHFATTLR